MIRPVWLRRDTWLFATTRLLCHDRRQLNFLSRQLKDRSPWTALRQSELTGDLLIKLGILRRPELLRDTVIRLSDQIEYLIPPPSASRLRSRERVPLYQLNDGKTRMVWAAAIRDALSIGGVFDQFDQLPTRRAGREKPRA